MATKALALLRAARKASLASRAAAAAASRAAAKASRSARVAGVASEIACAARFTLDLICQPKGCSNRRFPTSTDYKHIPDDCKTPTDKDLESDEAVWALYERWCKAFDKKRDHAEMVRRFKIFRDYSSMKARRGMGFRRMQPTSPLTCTTQFGLWDNAHNCWERILSYQGRLVLVVVHNAVNQTLIATSLGLGVEYFWILLQSNCGASVLDFTYRPVEVLLVHVLTA